MLNFKLGSLLALVALVVAQADPSINSPASVVQCQPVQLSWTATKEPVFISIIPGGQPGAAPLKDFGSQPAGTKSLTWKVDMKAGEEITFQIKDATGAVAYSANTVVQDSSDSSCVTNQPSPPSASSTRAGGGASSSAGTASAPAATTRSHAGSASSATVPAGSTRTAAAATSAQPTSTAAASNAARAGAAVQFGWTGVLGLFAIAGFAVA